MQAREGKETSFALVSTGGRVVSTFDEGAEQLARQQARDRGLRLFRTTTATEELLP